MINWNTDLDAAPENENLLCWLTSHIFEDTPAFLYKQKGEWVWAESDETCRAKVVAWAKVQAP